MIKENSVKKLVLIGASTGGPGHLKKIFTSLRKDISVPIVVAQHMGSSFIPSFVNHFKDSLNAPVFSLNGERKLVEGGIYVCGKNMNIISSSPLLIKEREDKDLIYSPNIDLLFSSCVKVCKDVEVMAILLTGIGHDGAEGMLKLYKAGAKVIGESERSAIVYGMPKKAKELNPELEVLDLDEIKLRLERFVDVF